MPVFSVFLPGFVTHPSCLNFLSTLPVSALSLLIPLIPTLFVDFLLSHSYTYKCMKMSIMYTYFVKSTDSIWSVVSSSLPFLPTLTECVCAVMTWLLGDSPPPSLPPSPPHPSEWFTGCINQKLRGIGSWGRIQRNTWCVYGILCRSRL